MHPCVVAITQAARGFLKARRGIVPGTPLPGIAVSRHRSACAPPQPCSTQRSLLTAIADSERRGSHRPARSSERPTSATGITAWVPRRRRPEPERRPGSAPVVSERRPAARRPVACAEHGRTSDAGYIRALDEYRAQTPQQRTEQCSLGQPTFGRIKRGGNAAEPARRGIGIARVVGHHDDCASTAAAAHPFNPNLNSRQRDRRLRRAQRRACAT